MTDQQQAVCDYLRRHGGLTAAQLVAISGASDGGIRKALAALNQMGVIRMATAAANEKKGRSKITVWELVR